MIQIVDEKEGRKISEKKIKGAKSLTRPSISADGKIIIGSSSGELFVLDMDLKILQKIKLVGSISADPIIYPNGMAVITDIGNVYIFH